VEFIFGKKRKRENTNMKPEITVDERRAAFEAWMRPKFSERLRWSGHKYEHPRTQMQWTAFCMGWNMRGSK